MLTFLTVLTMGMVTTLAMVLSREEDRRQQPQPVRRVTSGVRIRVTR
jgi:hypothetical protein